jgi:hypothetical protein
VTARRRAQLAEQVVGTVSADVDLHRRRRCARREPEPVEGALEPAASVARRL